MPAAIFSAAGVVRLLMRAGLALSLLAAVSLAAVGATGPDGLNDVEATAFLASLQDAIRADQPKQVAALVHFPLRVNYASKRSEQPARVIDVRNADDLVRRYADIFTTEVRAAVLGQTGDKLFRNWQGVMIGNGEVWYAGICKDSRCSAHRVLVVSVNVPK